MSLSSLQYDDEAYLWSSLQERGKDREKEGRRGIVGEEGGEGRVGSIWLLFCFIFLINIIRPYSPFFYAFLKQLKIAACKSYF